MNDTGRRLVLPRPVLWAAGIVFLAGAALRLGGLRDQGLLFHAEEQHLLLAETMVADARTRLGLEAAAPFATPATFIVGTAPPGSPAVGVGWPAALAVAMGFAGGPAEWTGRLLAALCGIAGIPVAFLLGRAWFRDWDGAIAVAGVCALMPSYVWWSRIGLPSAALLLLLSGGVAALLYSATAPRGRWLAAVSGIACALAVHVDVGAWPFVAAVAAFQGLSLGREADRRTAAVRLLMWTMAFAVVWGAGTVYSSAYPQSGAAPTASGGGADARYFPYWFFRREGVGTCLLAALGVLGLRQMGGRLSVFLLLLLVLPIGWGMAAATHTPLPAYPFAAAYVGVAVLAGGGAAVVAADFAETPGCGARERGRPAHGRGIGAARAHAQRHARGGRLAGTGGARLVALAGDG